MKFVKTAVALVLFSVGVTTFAAGVSGAGRGSPTSHTVVSSTTAGRIAQQKVPEASEQAGVAAHTPDSGSPENQ